MNALDADLKLANRQCGGGWDIKRMVEWAAQRPDSTLHAKLVWDDSAAGSLYREHQMRSFVARMYITSRDDPPRRVRMVLARPQSDGGGYVERQKIVGRTAMRLRLSIDAVEECATRIENLGFEENDMVIAQMRKHVEQLAAKLRDEAA
ncbi:MAG: hypothetical protein ABWZ01_00085 [Methyloceanibacter sp.]